MDIGLHRRAALKVRRAAAAHGSFVGKLVCRVLLTESMTESETNLNPALRRDEIMPVGSFWFWPVPVLLSRTFLGYHPPYTYFRLSVQDTHGEHRCHPPAGRENHDLSL